MLPGKQIESSLWLNLTENKSEVKLLTIWKRGVGVVYHQKSMFILLIT